MAAQPNLLWLKQIQPEHLKLVGLPTFNTSLLLGYAHEPPNTFTITSQAFRHYLQSHNLHHKLDQLLHGLDPYQPEDIQHRSSQIKRTLAQYPIPNDLAIEVTKAYHKLAQDDTVLLKSSLFTNQSKSLSPYYSQVIPVIGDANILNQIFTIWKDIFSINNLINIIKSRTNYQQLSICITVQKLINPKASGTLYTHNPHSQTKNSVLVEAIWGSSFSKHHFLPDTYTLSRIPIAILSKEIVSQTQYHIFHHTQLVTKPLPKKYHHQEKLTDNQLYKLASVSKDINQDNYYPQTVSWLSDGKNIYLYHLAPSHVLAPISPNFTQQTNKVLKPITQGTPISPGIVSGHARIVTHQSSLYTIKPGDILITNLPVSKLTELPNVSGLIFVHDLPISEKQALNNKIPTICNASQATQLLKSDHVYTINGKSGAIYQGGLPTSLTKKLSKPQSG